MFDLIGPRIELQTFRADSDVLNYYVNQQGELFRSKWLKITFKLEEPEIVLVTSVKSLDAEAIILGMELDLNYDMIPDGSKQIVSVF